MDSPLILFINPNEAHLHLFVHEDRDYRHIFPASFFENMKRAELYDWIDLNVGPLNDYEFTKDIINYLTGELTYRITEGADKQYVARKLINKMFELYEKI